jgi:hypothetical protein
MQYLSNPLQSGVYHAHFTLDFSDLEQLIRETAKKSRDKTEAEELTKIANDIKEGYFSLSGELPASFSRVVSTLALTKDCPKEIIEYLVGHDERQDISDRLRMLRRRSFLHRLTRRRLELLKNRIFDDINDVISVEMEETENGNLMSFEVTSLKETGSTRFCSFLKSIPYIGSTFKEVRSRKTHSSRYVFRPYPLAVRLWLESSSAVAVSKDLRDFLTGSIKYHSDEEWRTAIVLSAIAVESVLADLYEEHFKEYAPNVPLGNLYEKVKDKIKFPPHISHAIEIVNEARIAAVHRSRFPVSDREATNALYGATTFLMWYSMEFK